MRFTASRSINIYIFWIGSIYLLEYSYILHIQKDASVVIHQRFTLLQVSNSSYMK